MVASFLPKSFGEACGKLKPAAQIASGPANSRIWLLRFAAILAVSMQIGCAVIDLPRGKVQVDALSGRAESPGIEGLNFSYQKQVARDRALVSESDALKHGAIGSPSVTRPVVSRETQFNVTRGPGFVLPNPSVSTLDRRGITWSPSLLVRANDEPVNVTEEKDNSTVGQVSETTSSESVSVDIDSLKAMDDIEFMGPQTDEVAALDFGSERWSRVKSDYRNFYSQSSLLRLGTGFLVGAAMANTAFDRNFTQDVYRDNVIDIANEDIAQTLHQPKVLGDGYILLPALGVLAVSQPLLERSEWTSPLGELGDRGARAIIVGGPVVMLTQNLTGASRPYESPSGSHWEPFQDNNGVSGHAFVGAIPFLAAGKMSRQPWAKAVWYGASVLPAVSRVNDDRHYFSQVFLGWYIAWLATNAVDNSIQRPRNLRVAPTWSPYGPGLMLEKQF